MDERPGVNGNVRQMRYPKDSRIRYTNVTKPVYRDGILAFAMVDQILRNCRRIRPEMYSGLFGNKDTEIHVRDVDYSVALLLSIFRYNDRQAYKELIRK